MINSKRTSSSSAPAAGYVAEVVLRIALLLAVLGQVVFLASRYRTRIDVTGDKLYSLTDSTRSVLANLEDRLLIEAYFSDEDRLPTVFRESRRQLENFLDEYVQLSGGKVVIQKLNPHEDKAIEEKAQRLGIQRAEVRERSDAGMSAKEIWQGLRLMYGADKQEVIPLFGFQQATAMYEAQLTPKIKALTVKEAAKVGLLAFPTEAGAANPMMGGGASQPKAFDQLRDIEGIKGRYEFQNIDLSQGQLVPDEISTMMLVRPKNLTDRQKYALDQFLMRGGNLVVFADTHEYEIGQQRTMRGKKVNYDAAGSKLEFLDQLAHYGAVVQEKVVADGLSAAKSQFEEFTVIQPTILGNMAQPIRPYPYWYHATDLDYAEYARDFVGSSAATAADRDALLERYRAEFKPGIAAGNQICKAMKRGPGMFWPCPVDLAEQLPEGVSGEVLLRTSPYSYIEDPPADLNPFGMNMYDPRARKAAVAAFRMKIQERFRSEPRQQFGLMVELKGEFSSFFAGKDIPSKRVEAAAANAPGMPGMPGMPGGMGDPLAEPIQGLPANLPIKLPTELPGGEPIKPASGEAVPTVGGEKVEPAKTGEAKAGEGKAGEGKAGESKAGESKAGEGKAGEGKAGESKAGEGKAGAGKTGSGGDGGACAQEPATTQEPKKVLAPEQTQDPEKTQEPEPAEEAPAAEGPPAPAEAVEEDKDKDPDPIFKATAAGRLIVIGDSDFIRDDLTRQEYGQAGGPVSRFGLAFFGNLVDEIAGDSDLLALRNKSVPDRRINFVEGGIETDPAQLDEQVRTAGDFWRWFNIVGPFGAIMVIWLVSGLRRRARKQSFLASVQG